MCARSARQIRPPCLCDSRDDCLASFCALCGEGDADRGGVLYVDHDSGLVRRYRSRSAPGAGGLRQVSILCGDRDP